MMARPIPRGKEHAELRIPEERKGVLYEAMFTIFGWDKHHRDMQACICGVPLKHRPKLQLLLEDLGIKPEEYLAELQRHSVFAEATWEQLLTTEEAHARFGCTPAFVLYHYLSTFCQTKGIRHYRGVPI